MNIKSMSFQQRKRLLGWKPNRKYRAALTFQDILTSEQKQRARATDTIDWKVDHLCDQGNTPHCVGYGHGHRGIALPIFQDLQNADCERIYYRAVAIGGHPNSEDGAETAWGAEAMVQLKYYTHFAMTFSFQDVLDYLFASGPVVIGMTWFYDDFEPSINGLLPGTGGEAGGHEICAVGANRNTERIKLANSWGDAWSIDGYCYIAFADLKRRIEKLQGDACVPVEPSPEPDTKGCLSALATAFQQAALDKTLDDKARLRRALLVAVADLEKKK